MGTVKMQTEFVKMWKREAFTARLHIAGASQDEINFVGLLAYNAFMLEGEVAAVELVESRITTYTMDNLVPEEA